MSILNGWLPVTSNPSSQSVYLIARSCSSADRMLLFGCESHVAARVCVACHSPPVNNPPFSFNVYYDLISRMPLTKLAILTLQLHKPVTMYLCQMPIYFYFFLFREWLDRFGFGPPEEQKRVNKEREGQSGCHGLQNSRQKPKCRCEYHSLIHVVGRAVSASIAFCTSLPPLTF